MSYLIDNAPFNEHELNTRETAIYIGPEKAKRGEVFCVRGVWIQLPKPPKKAQIDGYEKKKSEQTWVPRPVGDKDVPLQNKERMRVTEDGHWVFINGEETWIPPQYYYYLTYIHLDIGLPEFRYRDLYFMYFWEAAKRHPKCYGVTLVKNRRMGASWIGVGILLYDITHHYNALGGILSKTGKDAQKFFKRKLVYAWRKLPAWLSPACASGTNPATSLDFTVVSSRAHDALKGDAPVSLDSYIEWRNTDENSFDSEKLFRLFYDEVGKIDKEVDLNDQIETLKKCTLDGKKIVGKIFAPSTVNKMQQGGGQYKKFYYDSRFEQAEREETPTGLWAYAVAAYDGRTGYIDVYGRSIIHIEPGKKVMTSEGVYITEGAKDSTDNKRRLAEKRGASFLMEEKRKEPYTEEEAFYFGAEDAALDVAAIQAQLDFVRSKFISTPVRIGDLEWENGFGTTVRFVPNPNGRFYITWLPPKEDLNSVVLHNGKQYPGNYQCGRGGCDPYNIDVARYGGGSKGSFHFGTMEHPGKPGWESNLTFIEYLARPKLSTIFYEDMLKAAILTGLPVMVENNKDYIIRVIRDEWGFGNYLMDTPVKKTKGRNKAGGIGKGVYFTDNFVVPHTDALKRIVYNEMGIFDDGSYGTFLFERTMEQMIKYNIDNRTDLDAVASIGIMEYAKTIPIDINRRSAGTGMPLVKIYRR